MWHASVMAEAEGLLGMVLESASSWEALHSTAKWQQQLALTSDQHASVAPRHPTKLHYSSHLVDGDEDHLQQGKRRQGQRASEAPHQYTRATPALGWSAAAGGAACAARQCSCMAAHAACPRSSCHAAAACLDQEADEAHRQEAHTRQPRHLGELFLRQPK